MMENTMNFYRWRYGADESLEQHDRRHHPGGYREGDTCKLRDSVAREDTESAEGAEGSGGGAPDGLYVDKVREALEDSFDVQEGGLTTVEVGSDSVVIDRLNGAYKDDYIVEKLLGDARTRLSSYGISLPKSVKVERRDSGVKFPKTFARVTVSGGIEGSGMPPDEYRDRLREHDEKWGGKVAEMRREAESLAKGNGTRLSTYMQEHTMSPGRYVRWDFIGDGDRRTSRRMAEILEGSGFENVSTFGIEDGRDSGVRFCWPEFSPKNG